jgi:hypothetical protein
VVWAHDFRTAAEVNAFRWSNGYSSGNDPLGKGDSGPDCRRITSDGVTGGGCLELYRGVPDPDNEVRSYWWRPLSPFQAPGNGKSASDSGNGIAPRPWNATDGGSQTVNHTQGYYGHPDYHNGNFDGDQFYFQVRVKMDPNRVLNSPTVGKLVWFTNTKSTLTSQEIVTYSKGHGGNQGSDKNYFRMYRGFDFQPLNSVASSSRIQVSSQSSADWYYSGGWDVLLYRLVEGHAGVSDTLIEVWAATQAAIQAGNGYTKIWKQSYTQQFSDNGERGHNAVILAAYNNGNAMSLPFYHRYDQAILSHQFIPCPTA